MPFTPQLVIVRAALGSLLDHNIEEMKPWKRLA
jgi:hypothetical protein